MKPPTRYFAVLAFFGALLVAAIVVALAQSSPT
jgi:hypothetical protein